MLMSVQTRQTASAFTIYCSLVSKYFNNFGFDCNRKGVAILLWLTNGDSFFFVGDLEAPGNYF